MRSAEREIEFGWRILPVSVSADSPKKDSEVTGSLGKPASAWWWQAAPAPKWQAAGRRCIRRLLRAGTGAKKESGDFMRVSCGCGTYSIQTETGLETKLTVGAETNQVEMIIIGLPVDQNQIRFDVAVAMIRAFTGKGMIEVALG